MDKHVVKMITEHTQMLSTVVRLNGDDVGYKQTHINHPCNIWARQSLSNWIYLRDLTVAIHEEWQCRYPKSSRINHKAYDVMLSLPMPKIRDIGLTPFAQAMPKEYQHSDPIIAYRQYYIGEKNHIASWTNRSKPDWWNQLPTD